MQYPRKVQIGFQEGTCPLKCKKCHAFGENAKMVKEARKMPLEKAKQLIDEIAQMKKFPVIQPHIVTEPFANKDLKEIISYSCSKGLKFSIITNGILLDKEWMDFLIEVLNRDSTVSFSLDAVTQETYEKVRGKYNLLDLENKIKYLINNRGDKGPRISVNFVYEEDNYNEKELFLKKWKFLVDAVHIGVALDSNRKVPDVYRKSEIRRKRKVCPFFEEVLTIDSGGEVRLCPIDAFGETYLGNVFKDGIMSVWNGARRESILKNSRVMLEQEGFCGECEWGDSLYDFDQIEETEEFIIKKADYAVYYNRKNNKTY